MTANGFLFAEMGWISDEIVDDRMKVEVIYEGLESLIEGVIFGGVVSLVSTEEISAGVVEAVGVLYEVLGNSVGEVTFVGVVFSV